MHQRHLPRNARRREAGFTLLEACLAFGALAFGLLAMSHSQATLAGSIEASRERGQAVRLAQAELERQRRLAVAEPTRAAPALAQATSSTRQLEASEDGPREAVVTLDFTPQPALHHLAARVTVSWRDRQGRAQAVRLETLIAAIPP